MATRSFSGHESWVFRAHALDELCGYHPELIGGALDPGERVRYLVYSPLRDVDSLPFGIHGPSGSHALALTDSRLILSRDTHRSGRPPTVRVVPFSDILLVEIGEALTLGWLVFRILAPGGIVSETVFFQSSGIDLFRAVVRVWRRPDRPATPARADGEQWHPLASSPPYLSHQLSPVLHDGERPHIVLHSAERWHSAPGSRRAECVTPAGLYAVTEGALVVAESERPVRRGMLVFAVNVTCIDRRTIQGVAVARSELPHAAGARLGVDLQRHGVQHRVAFTMGEETADALARAVASHCPSISPSW